MKQAYRRWVCGLLACLAALLAVCGAVVYAVDPCLYYRVPDRWQPVLFNERYQMAGLAKNVEADTVLVGTSMAANYRASWIEETFGTSAVRLTIPDGYYSEFDQVMDVLFRAQDPERVIFGMDVNTLIRDESGVTAAMPDYLYNANPLDDIQYLLNKDTLYYSAYTLLANRWGEGDTIDEGFTWDKDQWWNHMTALANYDRPETAAEDAARGRLPGQRGRQPGGGGGVGHGPSGDGVRLLPAALQHALLGQGHPGGAGGRGARRHPAGRGDAAAL